MIGQVLATLFGYNASPSLTEVLAYGLYFGAVLFGLVWLLRRPAASRRHQPRPS
jgi:high-affinity Fe2+/Pb2+ permease